MLLNATVKYIPTSIKINLSTSHPTKRSIKIKGKHLLSKSTNFFLNETRFLLVFKYYKFFNHFLFQLAIPDNIFQDDIQNHAGAVQPRNPLRPVICCKSWGAISFVKTNLLRLNSFQLGLFQLVKEI